MEMLEVDGTTIDAQTVTVSLGAEAGSDIWPQRTVLDIGGQSTMVVHRPTGVGPTMVLCHGAGLDHGMWAPIVSELSADIDVVAYDLRGHGQNRPLATFSFAACVADLVAILDWLCIAQIHLVGVSMGGVVAQEFAIRHPHRIAGLTLIATLGHGGETFRQRATAPDQAGLAAQVPETLSRWFTVVALDKNGPAVQYARQQLLRWTVNAWREVWSAMAEVETIDHLPSIGAPVLCIAGEADVSTPPSVVRALSDLMPKARFRIVPGSHLFVLESPQQTAALLVEQHVWITTTSGFASDGNL